MKRRMRRKVTGELLERFTQLWDDGVKVRVIARRLGMSVSAVSRTAAREGLPSRPRGRRAGEGNEWDRETDRLPSDPISPPAPRPPMDEYAELRAIYGEAGLRRMRLTLAFGVEP